MRNEQSLCEVCLVSRPEGTALNFEFEKKFNIELQLFVLRVFILNFAVHFSVRYNTIMCITSLFQLLHLPMCGYAVSNVVLHCSL